MAEPKFPHVEVELTGHDGNAFAVMGTVAAAMRRAGVSKADIDAYRKDSMSGDYNHLLSVAVATVSVS